MWLVIIGTATQPSHFSMPNRVSVDRLETSQHAWPKAKTHDHLHYNENLIFYQQVQPHVWGETTAALCLQNAAASYTFVHWMRCGVLESLQKDLLEIHTNSAVLLLMKLIKKGVQKRPTNWYNSLHAQSWEENRSAVSCS